MGIIVKNTSNGLPAIGTIPHHPGSIWLRSTAKMLGRRIEVTLEVTENDPPHRQCVRITSGPIPAPGRSQREPADRGSTRFTQTFDGEVGGFFRLAEPIVGRVISRQSEADMTTLKDLLESGEIEGS